MRSELALRRRLGMTERYLSRISRPQLQHRFCFLLLGDSSELPEVEEVEEVVEEVEEVGEQPDGGEDRGLGGDPDPSSRSSRFRSSRSSRSASRFDLWDCVEAVNNLIWHLRCLRCSVCRTSLRQHSSCYVKNKEIFCKVDYFSPEPGPADQQLDGAPCLLVPE
ncbi:hypothetical protein CRUP_016869 [Coryphaenoides rupestris]|nr:hypothetical protein CRUP_016869 [Coryphaenoides rupestris]